MTHSDSETEPRFSGQSCDTCVTLVSYPVAIRLNDSRVTLHSSRSISLGRGQKISLFLFYIRKQTHVRIMHSLISRSWSDFSDDSQFLQVLRPQRELVLLNFTNNSTSTSSANYTDRMPVIHLGQFLLYLLTRPEEFSSSRGTVGARVKSPTS